MQPCQDFADEGRVGVRQIHRGCTAIANVTEYFVVQGIDTPIGTANDSKFLSDDIPCQDAAESPKCCLPPLTARSSGVACIMVDERPPHTVCEI